MKSAAREHNASDSEIKWLDGFTKTMLSIMIFLLICIFASGKYMDSHKMAAGGTDDAVNNMASQVTKVKHHPFIELPGDAEVGAFSVANFFAGIVIGHHWEKLFGKPKSKKEDLEVS
jgi:cobalt/nickel transport protein